MSSVNQLFLLADHIKLSLLERQRTQSLGLADSSSAHISRSLDQFRTGITLLEQDHARLEQSGDQTAADSISDSLPHLRKQLDTLLSQFHGFDSPDPASTSPPSTSPPITSPPIKQDDPKSVRFDDPSSSLFGRYRDDPDASPGYSDRAATMDNQQIHHYHAQILQEQDDHLDRLGESIGRQRELSMQIGDELDNHVAMLDEVDGVVDRHQSRLDRAKRSLTKVAKAAAENKQMTLIIILIVILVLLIAILK